MISRVLWPAGLLLLAAYFLYFRGLGGVGLLSVDEPRYVWIGRAMAESGDWISPRLYGEPWLEKPPLLYWMIAAAWKLGLRDELAARVPVAICALLFLGLFWWSLLREFGEEVAARATAILSTAGGWMLYAHVAVTDIPLAATFGAAMLLAWRGQTAPAGLALGLAVLAKGLVPLALALPVVAWWFRRRPGALIVPALLTFAVAAPWYVLCYQRHGRALFDELIVRQHFARFFDAKAQVLHPQPFWFYLPVLVALLLPWSPLIAAVRPRRLWTENEPARFLIVWLGFGFVLFSASAGKLPGYLLPLLPPAAALLGLALHNAPRPRLWLALVAGLAAALYAAPNDKLLEALIDADGSPVLTNLGWVGLGAGFLAGLAAGKSFGRVYALVAFLMAALLAWAVPVADRHTARPFVNLATETCAKPGLHRAWRYGFSYYAKAALPECEVEPRKRWHASGADSLYLRDASADPAAPNPPAAK